MVEKNEIQESVVEHVCKARRELVFKAWTRPEYVAQWWGPHGFTNPVCEWDAQPSGKILIHMRAPDGTVYPMTGEFREVVAPERLVFISTPLNSAGEAMFEILNTVTLVEKGDTTLVTVHARVLHATSEAAVHLRGMEQGWSQALERLAGITQGGAVS